MNMPTVVILAAGANSRFFPFNNRIHKSGYTLLGKSLFTRTVEGLKNCGVKKIIIVENPRDHEQSSLKNQIQVIAQDMEIQEIIQPEALGMGNALLLAKTSVNETFVVTFPSSIESGVAIQKMMAEQGKDGALLVTPTVEPWLYGIVSLNGTRITGIVEKPEKGTEPSDQKAQGVYLLSPEYFTYLESEPEAEYSFESALNKFVQEKEVTAVSTDTIAPSLKYPWHFFEFQKYFFQNQSSSTATSAKVASTAILDDSHGPIIIDDGAQINHLAKIVGPCYIGKNTLVGDYSFIRESSIEAGSIVGANTEIVRSILFEDVTIHYGYLADSIIGNRTRIAAGFISANRRYDRAEVKVQVKDDKVSSGKDGLGVLIGEQVETGIGVKTMPGLCVGAGSRIYPDLTLIKNVAISSVVKPLNQPTYQVENL